MLVTLGYLGSTVACIAALVALIETTIAILEGERKASSKRTALSVLVFVVLLPVGLAGLWALDTRHDDENAAAVKIIEERDGITVNDIGDIRSKNVTRWTINGADRDCYVTQPGFANVETSKVMCARYEGSDDFVNATWLNS